MLVPVEEWWDADDHLEDENAKCPPIDGEVVAVANQHLGGKVLSGATERVCELTLLNELCQAEVSHKKVAYKHA